MDGDVRFERRIRMQNKPDKKIMRLDNDIVTEYTSALWHYKPVKDGPEPFRDKLVQKMESQTGVLTGASIRGKKHCHDGKNRDDWFETSFLGEWTIIAVADGAGSRPFSRIGARSACKAVIRTLKSELELIKKMIPDIEKQLQLSMDSLDFRAMASLLAEHLQNSIVVAAQAVEESFEKRKNQIQFEEALSHPISIEDFASTLLVALLIPIRTQEVQEEFVLTCQIGDGLIVSFGEKDEGEFFKLLGQAETGEFCGETRFLRKGEAVSKGNLRKKTRVSRRKISYLMVMTDGVSDDYYPEKEGIMRIYLDLLWNGIVEENKAEDEEWGKEEIEPYFYLCMKNPAIKTGLFYSRRIQKKTGLDFQQLFKKRLALRKKIEEEFSCLEIWQKKEDERLAFWLDNYVERGSFDDRTLVIWHKKQE